MFDRFAGLLRSLTERRIFRYVVAYAAASWAALEVVDQLVGNEILPDLSYRATLSLVLCGFPGALIVSWFHGAKGRQEVPRLERWLLLGVGLFAITTTGFIVRSEMQAMAAAGPGTALAPTEDPRRVAVLYFEPRGGAEAEFLAAGLTETLIDQLSGVQGLHVVSRNGSRLFRGVSASPDSIGRTLQVGSLVDGTVSQVGDRIRIEVSLVAASSGAHLASKRLDGARSELFQLQDELGDTVAVFLRREIGTELGSRNRRAATGSLEAWARFQEGGQMVHQASRLVESDDVQAAARSLGFADSLFALAENADPDWVEPVVRRGWTAYQRSRLSGLERFEYERRIGEGLEHAQRALRLSAADPGALELQATLLYWRYLLNLAGTPSEADDLFHRAEDGFRRAISAAGGGLPSARNSLSHLLLNKGSIAEAKLQALQAYETDPFLENAHLTLWRIFSASWSLQDAVEASRYCREGAARFPRDVRFKECELRLFALPGVEPDVPRGWALIDEITDLSPPQVREFNRRRALVYLSMALVRAQLPDSASALATRARAGPELDPVRELAQLESITRAWLGETDEAVRQLSLYFAANPGAVEGYRESALRQDLPWYHHSLLTEPRFRELVGVN